MEDLIEAYKGYYEDNWDTKRTAGEPTRGWCIDKIKADTPRERLEVYCHWNGIIGFSSRLFEIATGEIHVRNVA